MSFSVSFASRYLPMLSEKSPSSFKQFQPLQCIRERVAAGFQMLVIALLPNLEPIPLLQIVNRQVKKQGVMMQQLEKS